MVLAVIFFGLAAIFYNAATNWMACELVFKHRSHGIKSSTDFAQAVGDTSTLLARSTQLPK
jgi:hypothetical protein